jgi:hypothetical protein
MAGKKEVPESEQEEEDELESDPPKERGYRLGLPGGLLLEVDPAPKATCVPVV